MKTILRWIAGFFGSEQNQDADSIIDNYCGNTLNKLNQDAFDNYNWRKARRNHPDGLLDKFDGIKSAEEWEAAVEKHDAEVLDLVGEQ